MRRGDWNATIEAFEYVPWRLKCHNRGVRVCTMAIEMPQSRRASTLGGDWNATVVAGKQTLWQAGSRSVARE
jgi:hypothetical protein